MNQSSWISARRATLTLSVGEIALLSAVWLLASAESPGDAAVLAGAALAPLMALVAALLMRGAEPLRAGRFLLRLIVARGAGALAAGGAAALLHVLLDLHWMPLAAGFSIAVVFQTALTPWVVHAAARRSPSCRIPS